eukprot:evm.model.NODE_33510_length_18588_cov_30.463848.5
MVVSAKAVELYVLKGGRGASGEYIHIGGLKGRPAVDHPFKYHYKFSAADLPEAPIALLQLRLTPHAEDAKEVYMFRLSVLVGDANARHKSNIVSSISSMQGPLAIEGQVRHAGTSGMSSTTTSMIALGGGRGGWSAQSQQQQQQQQQGQYRGGGVVATRNNANQVALAGSGGEGAVVAEALNNVMGKMLTVVSKKTKGYVGSTYKRTEDKIAARMKSMETKISGFEQVVGQNLERRLLDLEHVMATLNERIIPKEEEGKEEAVGKGGKKKRGKGEEGKRRVWKGQQGGGVEESKGGEGGRVAGSQQRQQSFPT